MKKYFLNAITLITLTFIFIPITLRSELQDWHYYCGEKKITNPITDKYKVVTNCESIICCYAQCFEPGYDKCGFEAAKDAEDCIGEFCYLLDGATGGLYAENITSGRVDYMWGLADSQIALGVNSGHINHNEVDPNGTTYYMTVDWDLIDSTNNIYSYSIAIQIDIP